MTERLPQALADQTAAAVARPVLLALFDFGGGAVRVWSGVGTLSWDSQAWTGVGTLGEVSAVEETVEVRATGAAFRLSGVPPDLLTEVIGTPIQGRTARLWLGFMTEGWMLIADPVAIFAGRMDTVEILDGAETAVITLRAENRLRDLERPRIRRYTTEDQVAEYAGDLGFQYVPDLQEAEIAWGVPA